MKHVPTYSLLLIALICAGQSVQAQTIRIRQEYRAEGSIVLLGDIADITTESRSELAKLSRLELITTPARRARELSVREVRELMSLNSFNPNKYRFTGARAVTVHPRLGRKVNHTTLQKIRTQDRREAKQIVTRAIAKHLTKRSGQKHDWDVSFMMGKSNAKLILGSPFAPKIRGGSAPWTGKQKFWVEVGSTQTTVSQFPIYAQVRPKEFIVTTRRAIRRGERISAGDVELRPAPPQLTGGRLVYHLEDVVGRETKRSLGTGQPVDARALTSPTLVKKRQLITVYARGPGVVVRMTARCLDNGGKDDLVQVETLQGRRRFSARVSGPQEASIFISPTIVSGPRGRQGRQPVSRRSTNRKPRVASR